MMEIPIVRITPITGVRHHSAFSVRPEMLAEELLVFVQRIVLGSLWVEQFLSETQREGSIVLHAECPHSTHDGSLNVHSEIERRSIGKDSLTK